MGFFFGWTIFQALFMRDMAGSYRRSLRNTFLPEMISMNGVMAGMAAVSVPWKGVVADATSPLNLDFWFVMSIALCAGFLVAYPLNWWLVSKGMKHGMKTVRPESSAPELAAGRAPASETMAMATDLGSHDRSAEDAAMDTDAPKGAGMPATELRNEAMSAHAMEHGDHQPPATSRLSLVTMICASFALLAVGVTAAGLTDGLLGT